VIKAFAEYYGISAEMVTAGNGSDELISIITGCFLEKGDTVVTLYPDFSMYAFYSSLYELNVEIFEKPDDLSVNVDELIEFCKSKNAKALIFSNPCNPTSLGIEKADVRKILKGFDGLVVLDEAYMDFWTESMLGEIGEYDNCIILKTCSKAVGMAAIRLGFAVACGKLTTALRAVKSPYNTDSVSQMMGRIIFSKRDYLESKRKAIIENTKKLYTGIKEFEKKSGLFDNVYESKTNFVFIKTKYYNEIFDRLLKESISIRKFDGFLRISAGNEYETEKLLEKLKIILSEIKGD